MYKVLLLFLFVSTSAHAQQLVPRGHFLEDSVKIGELIPYSLAIDYPRDMDVVFPDSLFDFSPFELEKKAYFNTYSDTLLSHDSAVYLLSTFEIDSVQYLTLPVFVVDNGDSLRVEPMRDAVILNQLVAEIPDSVVLIGNTNYADVKTQFNYPYWLIGTAILLIMAGLVMVIFGKAISRKIKLYRLKKAHKKFLEKYDSLVQHEYARNDIHAEAILIEWKKYMEYLFAIPYTTLTSKEVLIINSDEGLKEALHNLDRVIYAQKGDEKLEQCFHYLRGYCNDEYEHKIEEVKYA